MPGCAAGGAPWQWAAWPFWPSLPDPRWGWSWTAQRYGGPQRAPRGEHGVAQRLGGGITFAVGHGVAHRHGDILSVTHCAPTAVPTAAATAAPTAAPTAVPTPTPDARRGTIAFHAGEDIWTIHADGSGLTNLTQTAGIEEANAAWSADGAQLAFQSWADGGGVDVMNADGTGRRRVAAGFARNASYFTDSLAWAPDTDRLAVAFVSGNISIIDVSSGDRLDIGTGTRWLAWSPTGRYLTWVNGGTILAYDSTARSTFTIATMSSNVRFLNWFPTEDRLLFVGFNDQAQQTSTPSTSTAAG